MRNQKNAKTPDLFLYNLHIPTDGDLYFGTTPTDSLICLNLKGMQRTENIFKFASVGREDHERQ